MIQIVMKKSSLEMLLSWLDLDHLHLLMLEALWVPEELYELFGCLTVEGQGT